mmetsp:Transcript_11703/g.23049  ORF Transcript_11703/g.23049 Transcript_11703/m.23049 type:complete len:188 (+) Transcript_11703:130-693(+)|eukprot:CAMPEP_0171489102 /NCGR_PEP_ID=MMETSP0958-20121227/2568_1 /TAXON_ID=87120 /ORGANISM="Aurantiochytrium limacinum, Strain ATCCMYA-1381" /LENGTH=187 /DNA_ID=CAMNT_0012022273 /DNA_START=33 /DNA_END=596 /DNA_ORIENTATION=-
MDAKGESFKVKVERLLLPFVSRWWFPWAVGCLSALNSFVVILSAPLVVLYISAVLARPERRLIAAFANAAGVTIGAAVLVFAGASSEAFPTFDSDQFERTRTLVQDYGVVGCALYSCLPIILHPIIFFGLVFQLDPLLLLLAIFVGRAVKYIIMGQLALSGSSYLQLFGTTAVSAAKQQDDKFKKME